MVFFTSHEMIVILEFSFDTVLNMTVQSGEGGLLVCINMNNNKKNQIIPTLCETVDKKETRRKYVRSREVHSPGGMLFKADR